MLSTAGASYLWQMTSTSLARAGHHLALCCPVRPTRLAQPQRCRAPQLAGRVTELTPSCRAPALPLCPRKRGGRSRAQHFTLGVHASPAGTGKLGLPGEGRAQARYQTELGQQAARTGDQLPPPAVPCQGPVPCCHGDGYPETTAPAAPELLPAGDGDGCTALGEDWGTPPVPRCRAPAEAGAGSGGYRGEAARAGLPYRGRAPGGATCHTAAVTGP